MRTFGVITPTTGADVLRDCILALRGQECLHYIVIDGAKYAENVDKIVEEVGLTPQIRLISLEENVGKNGGNFYGHRIYAAAPFLMNSDIVCFLDQDNWVEPDYIESFRYVLNNNQWAYTLRNIIDPDGTFVCQDNFENLGLWPVSGNGNCRHHIDTSCFAVPRNLLTKISNSWYGEWGADRQFFSALKQAHPTFGCTGKYTLNYRLGSDTSRATKEMFLKGNEYTHQIYRGDYPWLQNKKAEDRKDQVTMKYSTTLNRFIS